MKTAYEFTKWIKRECDKRKDRKEEKEFYRQLSRKIGDLYGDFVMDNRSRE